MAFLKHWLLAAGGEWAGTQETLAISVLKVLEDGKRRGEGSGVPGEE